MLEFGLTYDFRNPLRPDWFTPWPQYYQEAFEHIAHMDQRGLDIISFCEHHGDVDGFNPHITESLVLAAERTKQASLGTYIIQLPYYQPVMLAERLAFVDIISGGRLKALGFGQVGSVWDVEMHMLGVNPKYRPSLLEEALEIIDMCWTSDEPFSYEGKRFKGKDIKIYTKPLQQPRPAIQVMAMAEASADRVARMGFDPGASCAFYDGLTSKERWDVWWPMWKTVCERHGRNPHDATISAAGQCFVTDDPERAAALHNEGLDYAVNYESRPSVRPYGDTSLPHGGDTGLILDVDASRVFLTPEQAITEFRDTFADRAPDQFLLIAIRPGMTWEQSAEYHTTFLEKVLPHLRDLPTRADFMDGEGGAT
jgi:alkanesulfonate monooxygenase SsuD/methylene tetrahydromethanopterin reductase-like flavin-dependent oxidoreductase (luciferase family)